MFGNGHGAWPRRPDRAPLPDIPPRQRRRRPPVSSIPLAPLPEDVAQRVAALGAHQVNLYRALAHAPGLLRAWMDFAWLLRGHTATSRRLRELMILRTALLHHSPYEWHQHRRMAREEGVTETQVAELEMWRTSTAFDECEKAALALTDAIVAGEVPPEIIAEDDRRFLLDGPAHPRRPRRADRGPRAGEARGDRDAARAGRPARRPPEPGRLT